MAIFCSIQLLNMQSSIYKLQKNRCQSCNQEISIQQIEEIQFNYTASPRHLFGACLSCKQGRCWMSKHKELEWNYYLKSSQQNMKKISNNLPNLKKVILHDVKFNNRCCTILTEANWPYLHRLSLSKNQIENQGLNTLTKHKWDKLSDFSIRSNKVTNSDLAYLSNQRWARLRFLSLEHNFITRKGIKALVKAGLTLLEELGLSDCGINDESLIELSKGPWKMLCWLEIQQRGSANPEGIWSNRGASYLRFADWPQLYYLKFGISRSSLDSLRYQAYSNCSEISNLKIQGDDGRTNKYERDEFKIISERVKHSI